MVRVLVDRGGQCVAPAGYWKRTGRPA
jgi:hypothetical protein